MWRIIAKALGEKAGNSDNEADKVAIIRLIIVLINIIGVGFIIANAIHHW